MMIMVTYAYIIDSPSRVEKKTKNCLKWLNHESYCLLPSRANLHIFYDSISIWMDEVLKSQLHPWHDFIPDLSLNFKQEVRMVSILIYIAYNLSLTCCIINCKESSIHLFSKWLHWIYDFT